MSNFIYDQLPLPFPKTNARPLQVPASQGVAAADWNSICQALIDIQGVLRRGNWIGIAAQNTDPAPAGVDSYLYADASYTLHWRFPFGGDVALLPWAPPYRLGPHALSNPTPNPGVPIVFSCFSSSAPQLLPGAIYRIEATVALSDAVGNSYSTRLWGTWDVRAGAVSSHLVDAEAYPAAWGPNQPPSLRMAPAPDNTQIAALSVESPAHTTGTGAIWAWGA